MLSPLGDAGRRMREWAEAERRALADGPPERGKG
jgi:hypothetical protein